jgi:hypothetical protein
MLEPGGIGMIRKFYITAKMRRTRRLGNEIPKPAAGRNNRYGCDD